MIKKYMYIILILVVGAMRGAASNEDSSSILSGNRPMSQESIHATMRLLSLQDATTITGSLIFRAIQALREGDGDSAFVQAHHVLSESFCLPEDTLIAYMILEELFNHEQNPMKKNELLQLLRAGEQKVVGVLKLCDEEIQKDMQNEFIYRFARIRVYESANAHDKDKGELLYIAAIVLKFLLADNTLPKTLRTDAESLYSLVKYALRIIPSVGEVAAEATGISSSSSSSSSSMEQPAPQANAARTNKRVERNEVAVEKGPQTKPKRQRIKPTNTQWYCAVCKKFLAGKESFDTHQFSVSHIDNISGGSK